MAAFRDWHWTPPDHAVYICRMTPPYDPANPSSHAERRKAFRLLFLCLMATGIGNNMLFAILPPLARGLAVPEYWVGAIYTVSAVLFMTMTPIWGALSDRRGRKPFIVFGLSAFACSTLIFAGAAWAGESGWVPPLAAIFAMALARTLFGSLGSATNPAAQAYVADRTSPAERTEALAGLTAAFGMGAVIGPTLAATLVELVGVPIFMVIISATVALGAWAVWHFLPEQSPPKQQNRPINPFKQFAFAADPRIAPFVGYGCVTWIVQSLSLSTLAFFIMDTLVLDEAQGLQMSAIALAAGAGALIVAQLVVIPAMKASARVLMAIGALITIAGFALMIIAPNYAGIVTAYILISFAFGLSRSGFVGGASIAVEPEEQGRVAGLTTATAGLGFIIGPVGGLAMYNQLGHLVPYYVAIVLSVIAALIAWYHPGIRRAVDVVEIEPEV
ncbi:MFS transporter [Maricaulis sp. W15]|uniref:MFS transporter n=1 Tax=Maricaulis sp. W15 TaxID=1772333 RepID=UPI000B2AD760|nr:MFS transporter [Maricaulis sp. W15]